MEQALRCPSCGSSLRQFTSDSSSLTCTACGKLISLATLECTEIDGESFPGSDLEIGLIGELFGKKWQIIGRMLYRGEVSEWDSEDSQFYKESWSYVDWALVSVHGDYAYISEDTEGYTFSLPSPVKTFDRTSDRTMRYDGVERLISEFGLMKLRALQGEFSWVPSLNETTEYVTFSCGPLAELTCEARKLPGAQEVKEFEAFENTSVRREKILEAFGKIEVLEDESAAEQEVNQWCKIYFIGALILLLTSIFGYFAGSRVYHSTYRIAEVPPEGMVVGPLPLYSVGRVHEIKMKVTGMPKNTWVAAGVTLLDQDQSPLRSDEKEFWHETGNDDGYWDESDQDFSKLFRLTEAGDYYAEIEVDPTSTARDAVVELSVYKNVIAARFLLIGALLLGAYGASLKYYESANPFFIFVGLVTIILIILKRVDDDD